MTNQQYADDIIRIFGLDSRPTMRFEITHGDADTIAALIDATGLGTALQWIVEGCSLNRYLYVSSDGDEAIHAADHDYTLEADEARCAIERLRGAYESAGRYERDAIAREIDKLKIKDSWADTFEECYE